jgi:MFS family permease
MSFQGAGAVAGGLTAAPLLKRLGDVRLAGIGIFVFGAADGFLLVPHVGAIAGAAAGAGVGLVWAIVAIATAYQRRSPSHLQGRVSGAANMLFSVPQTISIALGAALITVIDYRIEIVIMTAAVLLAATYLLTRRREVAEVEVALAA